MTTKRTKKVDKKVNVAKVDEVKEEIKTVKRFAFRFTSNVSIWGTIFAKDSIINLSEEELVAYRPYVICHDETSVQKKPCKRC